MSDVTFVPGNYIDFYYPRYTWNGSFFLERIVDFHSGIITFYSYEQLSEGAD